MSSKKGLEGFRLEDFSFGDTNLEEISIEEALTGAINATLMKVAINLLRLNVSIMTITQATGIHPSNLSMLKDEVERQRLQNIL